MTVTIDNTTLSPIELNQFNILFHARDQTRGFVLDLKKELIEFTGCDEQFDLEVMLAIYVRALSSLEADFNTFVNSLDADKQAEIIIFILSQ